MKSLGKYLSIITLAATTTLAGCTASLSPDTYTTSAAGQVNRVIQGTIISARPVTVSDDMNSGDGGMVGTIAGGAAGAIAGSAIGGGRGSLLTGIGGAVLGGALGNLTQKQLTKQQAIEYVVKTSGGSLVSVVQGPPAFNSGQRVLIEYGKRAHLVPYPG